MTLDNPYQPPPSTCDDARHAFTIRTCGILFWIAFAILMADFVWWGTVSHLFHRQKSTQYIYGPYWDIARSYAPLIAGFASFVAFTTRFIQLRLTR